MAKKAPDTPQPDRKLMMFHQSSSANQLRSSYESQLEIFQAQPALVQRFLEAQAQQIADAIVQRLPQVRFMLPDRIVNAADSGKTLTVPPDFREQMAGGLIDRITRNDLRLALRERLIELEQSTNRAVSLSAGLIRFTTVLYMVHNMLPSGRSVSYVAEDGEEIPTIPISSDMEPESAITAPTDAIVEEGQEEAGRGELLVPYVEYARRFYLPQWVAFDDRGNLLVNSVNEAEAHLASMERFLGILHAAVSLAPYIVIDEDYQRKRYGMLGQVINQGRALARYETSQIIQTIKRRASANDLNRGLSLSLPYFDDQELQMKTHEFEVIPAGRIMFVPAFVVRAAREEQVKVAQDTRLSPSTRKHLLDELSVLEQAFENTSKGNPTNHRR
ncbi:MAG: hypothetical protein ACM3PY_13695 [Omnitrophica WOR_2 bacterium]